MSSACLVCARELPKGENAERASKWDQIRAHDVGWFFFKSGDIYCPDHVPEWVQEWREYRDAVE